MALCRAVAGVLVSVACCLSAALAQNTGTIEGHVYGADTNGPLRTGNVRLQLIQTGDSPVAKAGGSEGGSLAVLNLNGSYTFAHVKPGRYSLDASAPGYLHTSDIDQSLPASSAEVNGQKSPTKNSMVIEVGPNQTVQANFELQRGAAVEGRVLFEDGSPVVFAQVRALKKDRNGEWKQVHSRQLPPSTDDRGEYRISGLPAGEYLIEIRKIVPVAPNVIAMPSVYSGSVFDKKNATPFKLTQGEERTGEDLTFDASALHRVSGVVVAQQDGHIVLDGMVQMEGPGGRVVASIDVSGASGSFRFAGIPEGQYTIKVTSARDVDGRGRTIREYGSAQQPLDLENDVTGLVITVARKK